MPASSSSAQRRAATAPRIAFIGAGSVGFCRRLVADLLSVPELAASTLTLQDISARNLGLVKRLIDRDLAANQVAVTMHTTTDQAAAVRDADFVINCARVGMLEAFTTDVEIPLRYGVDQCVGDTLCAGGIMYGQRGIPMILDLCRDIRDHARPGCRLLNYANPNAMMTWAANTFGGVDCIGLCHGVQGGHRLIAEVFGLAKEAVDIVCAGINHQTWYISIRHRGRDLGGRLLERLEAHPVHSRREKVRIDMLKRFGCFSTESNGHLSEYLAWYRKRPREIRRWVDLSEWIHGETGGYLRHCTHNRHWIETDLPRWLARPPLRYESESRSEEHGSYIIEGLCTGRVYRGHFNRINRGCITNLPADCVIEAPGYVDANGLSMTEGLTLPMGCAAVCGQSVAVQRLAVHAAVAGDDEMLRQALLLDPLVGAVCNPPEVWQMADEMLVAQARWLPQYRRAVAAARRRLRGGPAIAVKTANRGAARRPSGPQRRRS